MYLAAASSISQADASIRAIECLAYHPPSPHPNYDSMVYQYQGLILQIFCGGDASQGRKQ
jgi:hypothetical protein